MVKKSKEKPKLKMKKKSVVKPEAKAKVKSFAKLKVKAKIKSAAKSKNKPKTKSLAKLRVRTNAKVRAMAKSKIVKKIKAAGKSKHLRTTPSKKKMPAVVFQIASKKDVRPSVNPAPINKSGTPVIKRVLNPLVERRRPIKRPTRINQFNFMKAPGLEYAFEVGGSVEVYCDHEKSKERIRGWVKGIIVQVDNKMVAVQFRSNVYLTDGWMVPDRILWFPLNSENMRPVAGKKPITKDLIPDY